jgi:magnesium-protoporphyrin O-methyltransferase
MHCALRTCILVSFCIAAVVPVRFYWAKPVTSPQSLPSDDKTVVQTYFDNEGFKRWNAIYSTSSNVSRVQQDVRTGHQLTIAKVLNWLSREDLAHCTLCDAGCGVGLLSLPAARYFDTVIGVDISKSMIGEAQRRCSTVGAKNVEYIAADIGCVSGRCDTVTCIDVVIHYPTRKVPLRWAS